MVHFKNIVVNSEKYNIQKLLLWIFWLLAKFEKFIIKYFGILYQNLNFERYDAECWFILGTPNKILCCKANNKIPEPNSKEWKSILYKFIIKMCYIEHVHWCTLMQDIGIKWKYECRICNKISNIQTQKPLKTFDHLQNKTKKTIM